MDEEEDGHSIIINSFIAANTITNDNEEKEHIIIALHLFRDHTYMIDISINNEIIETKDFGDNEKGAYREFHMKQVLYFKKILVI